jgi:hypothetical protein
MPQPDSVARARFLRLLRIVTDEGRPEIIRLSAIRRLQAMVSEMNPIKHRSPEALFDQIKQPWETRPFLLNGRAVRGQVLRPPISLADVWTAK